jgi:phosphoglycolate phosphatase-like HAD superfamily hydrolase
VTLEAIIFDLDGTIIDSLDVARAAFEEAFSITGGVGTCPTGRFLEAAGLPFAQIGRQLGLPPRMEVTFRAAAMRRSSDIRTVPGIEDVLARCQRTGIPMAIFTGKDARRTRLLLRRLELSPYFRRVVTADDPVEAKPSPAGIELIAREFEARVDRVMFVGDSIADLRAGRAAAAVTVACTWGVMSRARLLDEGPDHCVDTTGELLSVLLSPLDGRDCARTVAGRMP